jgi:hypothetical protein
VDVEAEPKEEIRKRNPVCARWFELSRLWLNSLLDAGGLARVLKKIKTVIMYVVSQKVKQNLLIM